ncbi:hypothetical protein Pmar_PMAR024859 [Perkinsus marinus ATCC 50983]|uniref:Uncharacterized protein n=1 Tax=Perkinsus marinus (strain ATCC 50983 / TXsc) TaxID=423536 RepID=C5LH20_PERM5|nr:hypothetical protein Pmar_PMAR024859 [Perkinsus marinus ATCC 50983]EER03991.1 hypothetical protein Pmar_PMAR024859 [Perkinsus marinus ATCC 50983]|eukprot:XP_002772175.1 hypothetical protein Pmar_PMAR024859 [Perkinsus marinus ATCC 50983]
MEEEVTESSSHRSKQTQCENDENASVNLVVEEKEQRLSPSHRREDQMPKEQAVIPEDIDAEVLVKVSDLVWIRGLLDAQRKALEVSKATNSILADGIYHVLTPYMKEQSEAIPNQYHISFDR